MTTDPKNNLRLHHIVEAAENVLNFIRGVTEEDFVNNYEKQAAVIRQFEIIGEAANRLTPDFKDLHPEIDWSKVIGMRHKMIHDYFDVDIKIVWTTSCDDIPALKTAVEHILA